MVLWLLCCEPRYYSPNPGRFWVLWGTLAVLWSLAAGAACWGRHLVLLHVLRPACVASTLCWCTNGDAVDGALPNGAPGAAVCFCLVVAEADDTPLRFVVLLASVGARLDCLDANLHHPAAGIFLCVLFITIPLQRLLVARVQLPDEPRGIPCPVQANMLSSHTSR